MEKNDNRSNCIILVCSKWSGTTHGMRNTETRALAIRSRETGWETGSERTWKETLCWPIFICDKTHMRLFFIMQRSRWCERPLIGFHHFYRIFFVVLILFILHSEQFHFLYVLVLPSLLWLITFKFFYMTRSISLSSIWSVTILVCSSVRFHRLCAPNVMLFKRIDQRIVPLLLLHVRSFSHSISPNACFSVYIFCRGHAL